MADTSSYYTNNAKDVIDDWNHTDYVYYLMNVTKDDAVLPLDAHGGIKWSLLLNITASSHDNNYDHLNHPNIRTTTRRKLTSFHYSCCHGTSAFSIVDKDRNTSSTTRATNTTFGSGVLSPSKGIAFNRDDDFPSHGMTNEFELQPSESICIKRKKRPLSSMSLALTFHSSSTTSPVDNSNDELDKLLMALGSSGGPKIIDSSMSHQFKNEDESTIW